MLDILYEDKQIILINKKPTILVQTDNHGNKGLDTFLKDYLISKNIKQPFIGVPHRIDRPTSGIVIFALKKSALSEFTKMFQEKRIKKTYWALVDKMPEKKSATLTHYLTIDHAKNKSVCYDFEVPESQKAILTYKHICSSDYYHLLEIDLQTGRHHQI